MAALYTWRIMLTPLLHDSFAIHAYFAKSSYRREAYLVGHMPTHGQLHSKPSTSSRQLLRYCTAGTCSVHTTKDAEPISSVVHPCHASWVSCTSVVFMFPSLIYYEHKEAMICLHGICQMLLDSVSSELICVRGILYKFHLP